MRSRPLRGVFGILVVMSLGLGACSTSQRTADLEQTVRSLTDRNAALEQEVEQIRQENEIMRGQQRQAETTIAKQRETISALRGDLGNARSQFNELDERLSDIRFGDLDPQTDRALAALAARFPDLISYDAELGRLRFASDLTFDSGSDEVKSQARASLEALAEVLQSASGAVYEVQVVGHTDSQPISNPATRQNHPTNLHLSCHRAIAVRRALVDMGVPPSKIMAAGWGEHRPVVPNSSSGGTPQNRRVEIFLTRPSGGYSPGAAPVNTSGPTTEVQEEYDPIK